MEIDLLKICYYGHPALRRKCLPVKQFVPVLREIADKMFEIMYANNGIGLAAPQIGVPWQMFVMNLGKPLVFINPQVTYSGPWLAQEEGCLSLPGIYLNISRPRDVYIHAQSLDGKPFKVKYAGMYSRCSQHEYDHLCGTLILDKVNPLLWCEQILQLPNMPTEDEKQYCYWEQHDAVGISLDAMETSEPCNQTG